MLSDSTHELFYNTWELVLLWKVTSYQGTAAFTLRFVFTGWRYHDKAKHHLEIIDLFLKHS